MIGTALVNVFDALDFLDDQGLVTVDTPDVGHGRAYVWQEIRDKLQLDAAYFHGNVPVVYFKELQTVDDDYLWDLHRALWNHNRAPLLIAVLPQEVRVYNCFAPPVRDSGRLMPENRALLQAVQQVTDALAIRRDLSEYRRREIISGRFARGQQEQFSREHRVDNRLLENLRHVRRRLLSDGLSKPVANSLLGRSIFVRYLEDRGVIKSDYFGRFVSGQSFRDLLESSQTETYQLFDDLADRFNGDLFPINRLEQQQVKSQHLQLLGRFLRGDEVLSGQMYFWAYNFKYIPIELISAIYETFLDDDRNRTSAYYTPPEIVDFVLNEVLPFETEVQDIKILDPACGSGIFLVEAYRRLVTLHQHARKGENLTFDELRDLLTGSIYGVDLSTDAIQVAAFSCYLALLDFLEPKSIWEEVRFPTLMGANLFVNDFFDLEAPFNEQCYDIIVGNPPWRSNLTELADLYVQQHNYPIGDKQIAQAFLWRAPTLLADEGRVCLLAPSKGVLFNQSGPNRAFRRRFFLANRVTQIVDFSAFRHSLFRQAVAPMVAVFFGTPPAGTDSEGNDFKYLNPHPSPLSEALAGIVVFGDEVRQFSRRQVAGHPYFWKVALWGTPRDLTLIDDLRQRFPSLEVVSRSRDWLIRVGVTVNGSSAKRAPELAAMRFVPVSAVEPFHLTSSEEERIGREEFHRPGNPNVYLGPHVLVRGGVMTGGAIASAFLPDDAVFADGIIGIAGPSDDADYLKVACAYVNSSLARYYQFLTASQWGVERDVVLLAEHKSLPCAIPLEDQGLLGNIVTLVDRIQRNGDESEWRQELDDLVYRSYGVTSFEQQIIEDFLDTAMDRHYRGLRANAFEAPSTDQLGSYAQAFANVFENTTGGSRTLLPTVYQGTTSFRAASFRLVPRDVQRRHLQIASEPDFVELLVNLEQIATEQYSRSLYFRRNIKVYEPEGFHIVKPAERRFWTESAAYNDADETIAELLRSMSSDSNGKSARFI